MKLSVAIFATIVAVTFTAHLDERGHPDHQHSHLEFHEISSIFLPYERHSTDVQFRTYPGGEVLKSNLLAKNQTLQDFANEPPNKNRLTDTPGYQATIN